jgi:hypothetical protein
VWLSGIRTGRSSKLSAIAITAEHLKSFGISVRFHPLPKSRPSGAELVGLAMRSTVTVYVVKLKEFDFRVVAALALAAQLPTAVMGEHLAAQPVATLPSRNCMRVFANRVRHGAPSAVLWNTPLA